MVLVAGVAGLTIVVPRLAVSQIPRTRTYYLAAEEVEWDYAPAGRNEITGRAFGPVEQVFVGQGPGRIGHVYIKALYRAYTDSTFTRRARVPPEWEHLGTLGPVLRAVVGDTIRVVFWNHTRFPFSVHPHGVFYDKASEGAPTNDGTSAAEAADDEVAPGGRHTYLWPVPERAGPGPSDPSSVIWLYHSHVSEPRDTNAGLIGPILITARERARADGSPADVDREIITLFKIYDENLSPYLDLNLRARAQSIAAIDTEDETFVESNLLHTINGYVYGSMPMPILRIGEHVRWYTLGLGNEADVHTAHWHGNIGLSNGHRTDVISLLPGSMSEVDLVPDSPGIWLFHCHVDDHILAGMQARYRVVRQ